MEGNIERFKISNLHGNKTFDINIEDNTIILVGENGIGKTTVLQILFYALSGQFNSLAQYEFDSILIRIDGKDEVIENSYVKDYARKLEKKLTRMLPRSISSQFSKMISSQFGSIHKKDLELVCKRFSIPIEYVLSEISSFVIDETEKHKFEALSKLTAASSGSQILYLPTYRRIERELEFLLGKADIDNERRTPKSENDNLGSYVELVKFGMNDVVSLIDSALYKLKEFARTRLNSLTLNYLGDVVDMKYNDIQKEEIEAISCEMVASVLSRIPEDFLSSTQKSHLSGTIDTVRSGGGFDHHEKVICHYFLKLISFQNELLKQEERIVNYFRICNSYLEGVKFGYDYDKFGYSITVIDNNRGSNCVEMKQLSSGEKQVVSLFGHLYLSGKDRFIVLIDEPELSLSVPWQEKFLQDIQQSDFCTGLFSVTHSPFIYHNSLSKYARGLGEFIV